MFVAQEEIITEPKIAQRTLHPNLTPIPSSPFQPPPSRNGLDSPVEVKAACQRAIDVA